MNWLRDNPAIGYGIAGGLGLIALLLIVNTLFMSGHTPETSDKFYYYDMQTQELFADKADLIPPIVAPSGGEGVLAEVYACGDCDSGELFIGILRKYSPEAKKAIEDEMPPSPKGELIRLADEGSQWVPVDSEAGQRMRQQSVAEANSNCKSGSPKICFPD